MAAAGTAAASSSSWGATLGSWASWASWVTSTAWGILIADTDADDETVVATPPAPVSDELNLVSRTVLKALGLPADNRKPDGSTIDRGKFNPTIHRYGSNPMISWYGLILGLIPLAVGAGVSGVLGLGVVSFLTGWGPYALATGPLLQLMSARLLRPFWGYDLPGTREALDALSKFLRLCALFATAICYAVSNLVKVSLGGFRFACLVGSSLINTLLNMDNAGGIPGQLPGAMAYLKELGWRMVLPLALTAALAAISFGGSGFFYILVATSAPSLTAYLGPFAENIAPHNIMLFLIDSLLLLLPASLQVLGNVKEILIEAKNVILEVFKKDPEQAKKDFAKIPEYLERVLRSPAMLANLIEKLQARSKLSADGKTKEISPAKMVVILKETLGLDSPVARILGFLISTITAELFWQVTNNELLLTKDHLDSGWPAQLASAIMRFFQSWGFSPEAAAGITNITNLIFPALLGIKGVQIIANLLRDLVKCEVTLRRLGVDALSLLLGVLSVAPTLAMGGEDAITYGASVSPLVLNISSAPDEIQMFISMLCRLEAAPEDHAKETAIAMVKAGIAALKKIPAGDAKTAMISKLTQDVIAALNLTARVPVASETSETVSLLEGTAPAPAVLGCCKATRSVPLTVVAVFAPPATVGTAGTAATLELLDLRSAAGSHP